MERTRGKGVFFFFLLTLPNRRDLGVKPAFIGDGEGDASFSGHTKKLE